MKILPYIILSPLILSLLIVRTIVYPFIWSIDQVMGTEDDYGAFC